LSPTVGVERFASDRGAPEGVTGIGIQVAESINQHRIGRNLNSCSRIGVEVDVPVKNLIGRSARGWIVGKSSDRDRSARAISVRDQPNGGRDSVCHVGKQTGATIGGSIET